MKIDLDWIQKELDAGREVYLECVDRIGFLKDIDRREANEKILDQGALIVDYIDHDGDIMLVGETDYIYNNVIVSEEFKYFCIKRPAPTFDDLIDVAYRAYRDGIFDEISIDKSSFTLVGATGIHHYYERSRGVIHCHKGKDSLECTPRAIKYINSLYTETFVIESEEDLKGLFTVDENMTITTVSGSVFRFGDFGKLIMLGTSTLFKLIKGATVIRKRGK